MYILYSGIKYPCGCVIGSTMVYSGLPEDFPVPVNKPIELHADDGFLMRIDNPENYLRQKFTDGVLTLTNTPESEPIEEEPVPEPTVSIEDLQKDNKLLKAQLQAQTDRTDFLEDCIAEMASVVYE